MLEKFFFLFVLLIDSRNSLSCIGIQGDAHLILKNSQTRTFQAANLFFKAASRTSSSNHPTVSTIRTARFVRSLRGGAEESKKLELDEDDALMAEYDDLLKVHTRYVTVACSLACPLARDDLIHSIYCGNRKSRGQ